MINIIVAVGKKIKGKESEGYPIGNKGNLPWHNKEDMKWFKDMTTGHPVIMGRKTYESIGHPLPNRTNIVISSRTEMWKDNAGVRVYDDLEPAIKFAKTVNEEVFIIGGASIYYWALNSHLVDRIYVDYLNETVPEADVFFDDLEDSLDWARYNDNTFLGNGCQVVEYRKRDGLDNWTDCIYLDLVNQILTQGVEKDTRAGKTKSIFGRMLRFNLRQGLPLLTTKKVFIKGVIEELLWFLRGETNIKSLVDEEVHIWDDDAYRFYLEKFKDEFITKDEFIKKVRAGEETRCKETDENGITEYKLYKYGDLGPVYGKQWRNWNGVDQIKNVIETLKTNPDDRRIIFSAWNVSDIPNMALPPCHYSCQFYTKELTLDERKEILSKKNGVWQSDVTEEILDENNIPKRELSCMWTQRSVDTSLGLPFNIASYAILTHIVAHCAGMAVGDLIFVGGDCHIYLNQIDGLKEQMSRDPHLFALPKIEINPDLTDIDEVKYEDINIIGYKSYPHIRMALSVGL